MQTSATRSIRRAGIAAAAGGGRHGGLRVRFQGIVMPASDVSDEIWSYPRSSATHPRASATCSRGWRRGVRTLASPTRSCWPKEPPDPVGQLSRGEHDGR